jgi:hypothetical protein
MLELALFGFACGCFGVSIGAANRRPLRGKIAKIGAVQHSQHVKVKRGFADPNASAWSREAQYIARCRGIAPKVEEG